MRELLGTAAALLILIALLAGPLARAAPGPGADIHYFEATVVGTGSVNVDYGEERRTAKSNTSGVDGKASVKWRWEVRAVAFSEGAGGLVTRAVAARGRSSETGDVVSWGKGQVQMSETQLCDRLDDLAVITLTDDGRRLRPRLGGKGDFVPDGAFRLRSGTIFARGPFYMPSVCFHGSLAEHDFPYPEYVRGDQAPVPRGEFNPRSDSGFERDYPPVRVSHDPSEGSDPNSAHAYSAESRYSVEIDSISKRRFDKLVRKYQGLPVRDGDQIRETTVVANESL